MAKIKKEDARLKREKNRKKALERINNPSIDLPFVYDISQDIMLFLRGKKLISKFLLFFFEQSIIVSKGIKAKNEDALLPVVFVEKIFSYEVDYQFFIFILGLFIEKKSKNSEHKMKFFKDYMILSSNISGSSNKNIKKNLMHYLDNYHLLIQSGNYSRPIKWFALFTPRVIEKEGTFYEFKSVTFNNASIKNMPVIQKILEENDLWFKQEMEQVVFGEKACTNYWDTAEQQKKLYCKVTDENMKTDLDVEKIIDILAK